MKRAHTMCHWLARLSRGAVPVDGVMQPADNDFRETAPAAEPAPQPREALTSESEFDLAIYPRWGNFR